jgi:hypothetical protein
VLQARLHGLTDVKRHFSTACFVLIRLFPIALGLAAVTWGVFVLPVFSAQSSIIHVANRIIRGEQFGSATLDSQIPKVEELEASKYCNPTGLRSAAIIRLRLAEEANNSGEQQAAHTSIDLLVDSIHKSLSCSPNDSFLWLALYWAKTLQGELTTDKFEYLRLSYRLGPNEGWIAVRRNRLAFTVYEELPPDLANDAIDEFARLLQSDLYDAAVEIFTGPAWPVRDQILPHLLNVSESRRRHFANILYWKDYDVIVPGIDPPTQPH